MIDKRFILAEDSNGLLSIFDNEDKEDEPLIYGAMFGTDKIVDLLNEQQATINELQSIINHIKCEENCFDYDYCCETVCSLYNEIKHLKEENEQLKNKLNKTL